MDIGSTVGHYKILELIGQGGMGEVYLAQDTKLERRVALKVLPPEVAANDERRQRFEREAKAVAALNHPNIVTIHSVESDGDHHFLTMEFIAGDTLAKHIPSGGLEIDRLFAIAVPLADALATAHEQGITHRDLKPDNIMFDARGQVRLLDFGLAKLAVQQGLSGDAEAKTEAVQTEEGKILGTVYYMSPEQAEGKPVDARSDVFSLGVILYEMIVGRRPFEGDTRISTISSILKDAPVAVTEARQNLPRHLGRIINRCLHKDPERRFESAKGLRNELEELWEEIRSGDLELTSSTPAVTPSTDRVAAAPASAPSQPGPTTESMVPPSALPPSDPSISVPPSEPPIAVPPIPPDSVLSQSIPPLDPPKRVDNRLVAAFVAFVAILALVVLGPRVIETWSVALGGEDGGSADAGSGNTGASASAAAADRPSIAILPLMNTSGDEVNDAFTNGIHDDLITQISRIGSLRVISRTSVLEYADTVKNLRQIGNELGASTILEGSVQRAGDSVRINVRLTDARSDAQLWAESYTRELTARGVFEIQSEIATEVAMALEATLSPSEQAGLASVPTENLAAYDHYLTGNENIIQSFDEVAYRTAEESYSRAIELDPEFAEAHAALSQTHSLTYWGAIDRAPERMQLAFDAAQRALELDPDLAQAHVAMGYYYYYGFRDYDRALAELDLAAQQMPGSSEIVEVRGYIYRRLGRWTEAVEALRRATALDPRNAGLLDALASTYSALRHHNEAKQLNDRAVAIAPNNLNGLGQRSTLGLILGDLTPTQNLAARQGDDPAILYARADLALRTGDFAGLLETVEAWPEDEIESQVFYDPAEAYSGWALWLSGDREAARADYAVAREWYRAKLAAAPEDQRLHAGLGTTLAVLGERRTAIESAERAIELLPISLDAFDAPDYIHNLALVYAILGDDEAALQQLDDYFSVPGGRTELWHVEADPIFASVRGLPGWAAAAAKARRPFPIQ